MVWVSCSFSSSGSFGFPVSRFDSLSSSPVQLNSASLSYMSWGYYGKWHLWRSFLQAGTGNTIDANNFNTCGCSKIGFWGSVVVQSLCHVWLFVTPWTAARQVSIVLHYLPEFVQTHVHWIVDAIQTSHPLSPPSSKSITLQLKFFYNLKKN